jgi:hypothetical protein
MTEKKVGDDLSVGPHEGVACIKRFYQASPIKGDYFLFVGLSGGFGSPGINSNASGESPIIW